MKLHFSHQSQEGNAVIRIQKKTLSYWGNQTFRDVPKGEMPGAVVTFEHCQDLYQDKNIISLTLEHYPGMTERELNRILDEAKSRWPLGKVTVIHRVGRLEAGDNIVFVVAAQHIEMLLLRQPSILWITSKQTPLESGRNRMRVTWVDARDSDRTALKWNANSLLFARTSAA